MAFEKNKLPVWDLAGSLNEKDPPSEIPLPDVISVINWKPDKDCKSRIKRPGYDLINAGYESYNEPIRGIFPYVDPDGNEKIIIVTNSAVVLREDIYTWVRKWEDTDSNYNIDPRAPFIYQNKLCIVEQAAAPNDIAILETEDGDAWTTLGSFNPTLGPSVGQGQDCIVYADEIFIGSYSTGGGDDLVARYDGSFHEELPAPHGGQTTVNFHV